MKPPQPGDVVHYRQALPRRFLGKIDFSDKHLAIHPNDSTKTDVLAGVSLVEVLLAEPGNKNLALVDGENSVSFINGNTPTTIDLGINVSFQTAVRSSIKLIQMTDQWISPIFSEDRHFLHTWAGYSPWPSSRDCSSILSCYQRSSSLRSLPGMLIYLLHL